MSPTEPDPKRPDDQEPDTYELEIPDDDPPPATRAPLDLSSDVDASTDAPEPMPVSADPGADPFASDVTPQTSTDPTPPTDGPKVSESLYKSEPEPEFVDPEVARMRREDQRKRAAEQAAIEAEAKKKRMLLIGGAVCALVLIGVIAWQLFG